MLPLPMVFLAFLTTAPISQANAMRFDREALQAHLGPQARVVLSPTQPWPAALLGMDIDITALGTDAAGRSLAFVESQRSWLALPPTVLRVSRTEVHSRQRTVRLQQFHEGIPVYRHGATVTMDAAADRVRALHLELADIHLTQKGPLLEPEAAEALARRQFKGIPAQTSGAAVALRILAGPPDRKVYQVVLPTLQPWGRVSLFVDAVTGTLVWQRHDAIR